MREDVFEAQPFPLNVIEDCRTALDHGDDIQLQSMNIQNLLRIGEPAVKQDILRTVSCLECLSQQFHHDAGSFSAGHDAPLGAEGASVEAVAWAEDIPLLRRGEHREIDGKERAAIRPSERQETETFLEPLGNMVEYAGGEFRPLETSTFIEGVVYDEAVVTRIGCQRTKMLTYDPLGKQRGETKPVHMRVHEEAIIGVFREEPPERRHP